MVDFSHGQREWHYLVQFFERDPRFTKLTLGLLEQADLVSGASVLVMPPPMKSRLEASEIDCIEQRVDGGMGLLLMGCYAERHHETNFSELTWRFDLEFSGRRGAAAGIGDHELRSHVFSRDPRWAAKIRLDGGSPHPVLAGVHELVFLSAGSIRSTTQEEPELVVRSEPNSRLLRPLGHIPPDGSRARDRRLALHRHRRRTTARGEEIRQGPRCRGRHLEAVHRGPWRQLPPGRQRAALAGGRVAKRAVPI